MRIHVEIDLDIDPSDVFAAMPAGLDAEGIDEHIRSYIISRVELDSDQVGIDSWDRAELLDDVNALVKEDEA